ncbi:hypothetical protein J4410_01055 [Candidatus Woesearchaeota archaeon]|nr:hypothetical protein [Candidatus Woesearchaeota archaeon]
MADPNPTAPNPVQPLRALVLELFERERERDKPGPVTVLVTLSHPELSRVGQDGRRHMSIRDDPDGSIWFHVYDYSGGRDGIYKLEPGSNRLEHVQSPAGPQGQQIHWYGGRMRVDPDYHREMEEDSGWWS